MKIKFDKNQDYQLDAINAVVDVFEGQPLAQGEQELAFETASGELFTDLGIGNRLLLSDAALFTNVQAIQQRNSVDVVAELQGRNFSVEMETGTGKTYVYLRTIYELNAHYGWKKFIIVVPSVAIREGVMQTIKLTREHFVSLYNNTPLDAWVYESLQVSRLRGFATSNQLQLLVINIQAFDKKDIAVIHRDNDRLSGRRPIEFIQATSPIVIIDEPQNMESKVAKEALESLHPACTLRYSATHRSSYNLLYRLDPVKAYELRLVKRIEVDSVLAIAGFNEPYIAVKNITATKSKISAKLEIDMEAANGPVRKTVTVSGNGGNLYALSREREQYQGYVVSGIDAGNKYIEFENGVVLSMGESQGGYTDEIMRIQIEETVREHFDKELAISRLPEGQRLKVLSLFFIDRVANYTRDDGKIRRWFIEAYEKIAAQKRFEGLKPLPIDKVHNGYFAQDKHGFKDSSEGHTTKADDEAYHLIMEAKEQLLSLDEPLRFIFSHSALREGWDNPNVFQICTLNETQSVTRKRQEIGRGLRLPVRENGERSFDESINRLTIIANESYRDFAKALQDQMQEEWGGIKYPVANKRDREKATLKQGWMLDEDFKALWERIKHQTRYQVHYDTEKLITKAVENLNQLPPLTKPDFQVLKGELITTETGVVTELRATHRRDGNRPVHTIPDLLAHLQRETELTRSTLAQILIRSGRLAQAALNPQQLI
ncbi:MAG: DEAD/DEAH box helicase family protein, partial [Ardenticatenales bacterium]|nr:DEAD/DEAH box helicase family protein [Ardenticatenales bacterium]